MNDAGTVLVSGSTEKVRHRNILLFVFALAPRPLPVFKFTRRTESGLGMRLIKKNDSITVCMVNVDDSCLGPSLKQQDDEVEGTHGQRKISVAQ